MNRKVLSSIILFWTFIGLVYAQENNKIVIKGSVTDASTSEPVAFANLGILGTYAGVAADMNGEFELVLPEQYANNILKVSVVGYAPYERKVADVMGQEYLHIRLNPITYSIQEVSVYGQSLVYKKMLKDVVENIGRNYYTRPYNYQGYWSYTISENDVQTSSKEAVVTLYDKKGYHRSDVENAFKELNYRFSEVRRSRETRSVLDGLTFLDDVLTADIVRHTRNVLDIENARDYKLTNKGRLIYEGDSVQVIGYEVAKPALSTTGEVDATRFSGEIYVNLKNYAVLKNVMHISAGNFNKLGRNLIRTKGEGREQVKMTITTDYKKLDSRYFLSGVNIRYTYQEGGRNVMGKMQYVTTRVKVDNPEVIEGRMYYEDIKANPKFWDNYTVYFQK